LISREFGVRDDKNEDEFEAGEIRGRNSVFVRSQDFPVRIGYGWDSHEFRSGVPLKIGGIGIPHAKGLQGHSDGDVLLHAITDALLGAIAAPDIGTLFSPSDARWKGQDSVVFLAEALRRVEAAGYKIRNLDSTLILREPKIGPHADRIRRRLSELTGVPPEAIGIKAKTPEGMGTDEAAIAHAVVLLERTRRQRKSPPHDSPDSAR
jgi:2-C-methyl-D-erythritol 2,4-cyclodiphosphate synthase